MVWQRLHDPTVGIDEGRRLIEAAKTTILSWAPDREGAFELIYRPRLNRVLEERFAVTFLKRRRRLMLFGEEVEFES